MAGKRKIRKINILFLFCAFLTLFLCVGASGSASQESETERPETEIMEELKTHSGGIVRVESVCWDGEEKVYQTKSFSGFVVSGDTMGIHVVTIQKDLAYSPKEKANIKKKYNLDDNARIAEKLEIVFDGDLRVTAEAVGESDQRNLTVLKMNQNVSFEDILLFSGNNVFNKEKIYLLSYPQTEDGKKAVYNAENTVVTRGTAGRFYKKNEISFFQHEIKTDDCSAGGPILDAKGHIVGVLLTSADEKKGSAISGQEVREFLDTLNVSYQEYQEVAEEKKLPLLNLILGAVIAVLLLTIVIRQIRGVVGRDRSDEPEADATKRKGKTKKKKPTGGYKQTRNMPTGSGASLEYPEEKRFVIICKKEFLIGRQKEADFSLADSKSVSRRHACIRFDGRTYYLSDLQSTNFTFLNGQKIEPGRQALLSDGDEITVGKEKLIFHTGNK